MRGLRRLLREGRFTAYFMRDRRWVALSICLLISVFFWVVAAIDDPRGYTKEIAVQLDKPILPTNYRMTDLSQYPEVVYVKVHAKGGSLLRYTINQIGRSSYRVRPTVDTTQLLPEGGQYRLRERDLKRLLLSKPLHDVSRMDLNTSTDLKIYPEEISFSYEPLSEGKADVLFGSQIDFGVHRNFKLADTISLIPSSVRVFGVKSDLEDFMATGAVLTTDTIGLKIDNPGRDTIRVAVVTPSGIDARPDSVDVVLMTNELVYHSFTTSDIEIRNLPPGYDLSLVPLQVTVTYLVPKDKVGEETLFDPGLYIDAREAFDGSNRKALMVHVDKVPSQVDMIQVVPDRLDFILRERK